MRNSLADVVAAALRVLDAQGLENCSMRRVAAELEVQPSALYHHVADKQSLLALMADEIVRNGAVVSRGPGPMPAGASAIAASAASAASAARTICVRLRAAMLAVRDGADVVATAAAFRLGASAVEDRLAEAVGRDGARTLLLYTFGQTQQTQTHRQAAAFGALVDPAPRADAAQPDGDPTDGLDASFGRGLDIILAGLAASSEAEAG
ncbi:TetR/AcrR family transcriptional regulator [Leucobacter zeae]|nr:TetR/AcrR family transcriptional regulator [Leucobacter zeae]